MFLNWVVYKYLLFFILVLFGLIFKNIEFLSPDIDYRDGEFQNFPWSNRARSKREFPLRVGKFSQTVQIFRRISFQTEFFHTSYSFFIVGWRTSNIFNRTILMFEFAKFILTLNEFHKMVKLENFILLGFSYDLLSIFRCKIIFFCNSAGIVKSVAFIGYLYSNFTSLSKILFYWLHPTHRYS